MKHIVIPRLVKGMFLSNGSASPVKCNPQTEFC